MKNHIRTICLMYALGCQLPVIAQDSVRITLRMPATTVYTPRDLWFEMTIQLLTDRPIILPLQKHWGNPEDSLNYIYYIVEKKTGKEYDYFLKTQQLEDLRAPSDGNIPDTLSKTNPIQKHSSTLSGFYSFPKGSYRASVLYYSMLFKPQSIYSNWVYFTVKENIE